MVKSGTTDNASLGDERKLKNAILSRWQTLVARKGGSKALLSPLGEVVRTFAEIDEEAALIAERLRDRPTGAVVSLQAPNVAQWPAMILAIWKASGCALLLDHTLGEGSRRIVEEACGAALRLEVREGAVREISLGHTAKGFRGTEPDLIKLTSGTSGAPRAILFTAAQLEADCDHVCEAMGLGEDDVNFGVVAFSHSYGFSNLITPLLCRGIPLVVSQDALPRALSESVAKSGATVLPAVPAVFHALGRVEGAMPTLRLCISAGAPLRVETARTFRERFGLKIHTFYGASECGGIAYDANEDEILTEGFVGQSMPGVSIEIQDGGEIRVRGAAVGLGYFPEESNELCDGEFKPADLLRATPEGWQITGRRSDVINIGGKKASPSEIEAVLLAHPAISEAVAFAVTSEARTDAVCACVVAKEKVDTAALRAFCASRLAPWQVPRSIVLLDEIPVNARGKISRAKLAAKFADAI